MTKVVILAGGLGTRFSEETALRPKPMIEIGGMPILWHIMKTYSFHGFNDFVICGGYKQDVIKEFFRNYGTHRADVTFHLREGIQTIHATTVEDWRVTVVDTGVNTQTGGRLKRVRHHLGNETFFVTYGDGVADVDIKALAAHHKERGKLATLTAVPPPSRFGELDIRDGLIYNFDEKKENADRLINGGFMALEPAFVDYIDGDDVAIEKQPMQRVAREGQLTAYEHKGFWQCMDKLLDKTMLENLWNSGAAPWKVW